jgi:membrane protease YdiL (CAAX protease family)
VAVSLLLVASAGFAAFAATRVPAAQAVWASLAFALLFVPLTALSVERWRDDLAGWLAPSRELRTGALLAAAIAISAMPSVVLGDVSAKPMLWIAATGGLTIALLADRDVASDPMRHAFRLTLAMLALWIPSELGLLHGLPLPAGSTQGTLEAGRLIVLDLGLVLFLAMAPLPDVGYTFRFRRGDLLAAGVSLVAFAAVAIPLGMAIDFIHWGPVPFEPLTWLMTGLAIYFFTAVPEELLFRGALQNLLEKRWPGRHSRTASLLVAAVVFGAAHLNNRPAPNWRYMLLATLAGIAYGWVWQRTRRVSAAALTHAGVDWIWVTAFRG